MTGNADWESALARVPPHVIRHVMDYVAHRGHDPARLCLGLGFSVSDLNEMNFRVSYRQTRTLVMRAMQLFDDKGIGIPVGARQTIVSFGLPGLGMLTCETLGEALEYLLAFQTDSGAFTQNICRYDEQQFEVEVAIGFKDPEFDPFFIEETLASGVALIRSLVGNDFCPKSMAVTYPEPVYSHLYGQFFKCPITYNADKNRVVSDISWIMTPLPTHDKFMKGVVQSQLAKLMVPTAGHHDLIESIKTLLAANIEASPTFAEVAFNMNLSQRTLRRRLNDLEVSFKSLQDEVRYEHARTLLCKTDMPVADVASAVGFNDDKNFRRAFRRWSGDTPSAIRARSQAT